MRPSDLLWRIHRLERARGAGSVERAGFKRIQKRFKREEIYQQERDRLAALLPPGWRLVRDMQVGVTGHITAERLRPTLAPQELDNGMGFNRESGQITSVSVMNGGCASSREPYQEDRPRLQREAADPAVPAELRRQIAELYVPMLWPAEFADR